VETFDEKGKVIKQDSIRKTFKTKYRITARK
jgi:hypothetical protein